MTARRYKISLEVSNNISQETSEGLKYFLTPDEKFQRYLQVAR